MRGRLSRIMARIGEARGPLDWSATLGETACSAGNQRRRVLQALRDLEAEGAVRAEEQGDGIVLYWTEEEPQ
jgi:hypothetical protein